MNLQSISEFKSSEHAKSSKNALGNCICKDTKMRKMLWVLISNALAWNVFFTFTFCFLRVIFSLFSTTETYSCGLKLLRRPSFMTPAPDLCRPPAWKPPHCMSLTASMLASVLAPQGWGMTPHHWSCTSERCFLFILGWTPTYIALNWGEVSSSSSLKKAIFIWLCWDLVEASRIVSCGMGTLGWDMWDLVPWPGLNLGPLHLAFLSHWMDHQGGPSNSIP